MSLIKNEFITFEDSGLVSIPELNKMDISSFKIGRRLYPDPENEHPGFDCLAYFQEGKKAIEKDILTIHGKIYFHFGLLGFTPQEIEALKISILAIYRQVVEEPLDQIEAQVDQQIATLANNIMLRRLMERTRESAMGIL